MLNYIFTDNLFKDAFNAGKSRTGAKDQLDRTDYESWRVGRYEDYISALDKDAIEQITNSSEHYTKKLVDGISNKMLGKVLEAEREAVRSHPASPIGSNPYVRQTQEVNAKKLAKEFEEVTKDSFRDFTRITAFRNAKLYLHG